MSLTRLDYLILLGTVLSSALLALFLGKDLNWDLANYHYYIPYAYLYNRYTQDYWPSGINTFYNPTLDFLTFFLINHLAPWLVVAVIGALQGILLWLLYLVNLFILKNSPQARLSALVLTAVALYSPQFINGLGMTFGDLIVGEFLLASILLIFVFLENHKILLVANAGVMFGLGVGLKLTLGFYYIGFLVGFLALSFKVKVNIKIFFWLTLGFLLGFAITNGYWMYFLWIHFKNPFFPLFNNFFHSNNFEWINWSDKRFLPKSLWQALLFPFFSSFNFVFCDDIPFIDVRLFIVYFLLLVVILKFVLYRQGINFSRIEGWLVGFFIGSYIAWELTFAYMRYAVVLMLLAPLIIFILIKQLTNQRRIQIITTGVLLASVMLMMVKAPAERGSLNEDDYFGIKVNEKIQALRDISVFIPVQDYHDMNHSPLSVAYVIPFLPSSWHFLGVTYSRNHSNFKIDDVIRKHLVEQKKIYLLSEMATMNSFKAIFNTYHFKADGNCEIIPIAHGLHRNQDLIFCQYKKSRPLK